MGSTVLPNGPILLERYLMIIYWRTCELQKAISYTNRWKNYNKTDILKTCWLSVQENLTNSDQIYLIEDNLTQETLTWLIKTSKAKLSIIHVPEHTWEYHQHTVTLMDTLEQSVKEKEQEVHLILEDDYIFVPNGIPVFKQAAENWNEGFIVPYDYIDRYKEVVPCQLILGPDRHWRTVNSITMTVAAKGFVWVKYLKNLREAAPTSNDKIFESILEKIPCIAPIPSLASHLTEFHNSPYMNIEALWDYYNKKK